MTICHHSKMLPSFCFPEKRYGLLVSFNSVVERMVTYEHSTSHTDWPLTYIDNSGYNITVDCNGWSVLAPLGCILLHCGFHM